MYVITDSDGNEKPYFVENENDKIDLFNNAKTNNKQVYDQFGNTVDLNNIPQPGKQEGSSTETKTEQIQVNETKSSQNNQQENTESSLVDTSSESQSVNKSNFTSGLDFQKILKNKEKIVKSIQSKNIINLNEDGAYYTDQNGEIVNEENLTKDEKNALEAKNNELKKPNIYDKENITNKILTGKADTTEKQVYASFANKNNLFSKPIKYTETDDIPPDGGFFEDLYINWQQGLNNAKTTDEALTIFKSGNEVTDEDIRAWIDAVNKMDEIGPTQEQVLFQKKQQELGGGVFGTLGALYENPGFFPQMLTSSIATMIGSFVDSDEIREVTAASAVVGAGAGAGIGASSTPYIGGAGAIPGAITGAISGAMGGLIGSMETALTFTELFKEELGENDFNEENIRNILNDPDAIKRMKNRAVGRGIAIGAFESFTLGLSRGFGSALAKTGSSTSKVLAVTTATETGGAFVGELAGQTAAGQELDFGEATLEAIGDIGDVSLVSDIVSQTFKKSEYTINGENRTKQEVNNIINDPDISTEDLAKIDVKVKGDKNFSDFVKSKQNDAVLETQIDPTITGIEDRKKLVDLQKRKIKAEQDVKKTGVFKVIGAEKKLENINNEINEIITPYEAVDARTSDVRAQKKTAKEVRETVADKEFKSNLEFAKKHSSIYGLKVDDTLTPEQIKNEYGEEAASSDGFIVDDKIIINKKVARQARAVNVGNHELLHGILRKQMKNKPDAFKNIRQDLKNEIGEQWNSVEQRVKDAGYTDQYMQDNPDEWITLTSDAIANGDITYSESIFQPLADFFLPILRAAGFKKIKFETGKDVFNFLKEYNKSIHKGALSTGIISETKAEVKSDDIKFSRSSLIEDINKMQKTAKTKAEFQNRKIFNPIYSSVTQPGGAVNNYIRSLNLTPEQTEKTIDNVADRLMNFNPQTTRKTGSKEPITLGEFIMSNVGFGRKDAAKDLAIEAAKTKQEFRVDVTKDGERSFDIEDTAEQQEITLNRTKDQEYSKLRRKLKLDKPMMDRVRQAVTKTFGTKLPDVESKKFKQELQKRYRTELKKPIQDMIGTRDNYKNFLDNNFESVYEFLPTSTLTQMERNIPNENRIFVKAKETNISPTRVDELVSQGKLPKNTNRTSGPTLFEKQPYPGNEKVNAYFLGTDMQNQLGYERGASTLGTRKDKLAMSIAEELGFDATMETIQDPAIQEKREFLVGKEKARTERPTIAKQIDRDPTIKFSKQVKNAYRKSPANLAKDNNIKLIPGSSKTRVKDAIYNKETRETFGQARNRVVKDFLTKYPQYRLILQKALTGGSKRSMYVSVGEFNEAAGPVPKGVKLINVKRTTYNENRRFTEKAFKKFKTKEFKQNEAKKLKALKDFFITIQDYSKSIKIDGKVNPDMFVFFEMLRDSSAAGQGHIIRVLAPVKFYTVDQKTKKPIFNKEVVEEHTDPQNQIGTALMDAAINENVNEVFDVIGGSYMQGSLLLEGDNLIANKEKNPKKRDLTRDMPDIYFNKIIPRIISGELKLPPGMASVVRMAVQGVNLNQLMLIDSNQTMTEFFDVDINTKDLTNAQIDFLVPYQNELIVKQLTNKDFTKAKARNSIKEISNTVIDNTNLKSNNNIQKALQNRIKFSKTNKRKGISVFDFDDTLAKTKSGIRATIPNPDGTPKPNRKVVFLAGGAGSGKGNVISKLGLSQQGFKIVNSDISLEWLKKNSGLPADMRDLTKEQRSTLGKLGAQARKIARGKMMKYQGNANGVVVDGTGGSVKSMQKLVDEFKSKGYDVSMLFVDTSLDVALERNRARKERSLLDVIVKRNHESVQNNKSTFQSMFGDRFMEVNTDNLTQASPMPMNLVNDMNDFVSGYEKVRLDAEQFAAEGESILERGGEFDFSEFNDVVDGTPGPLLDKAKQRIDKFGNKDVFVLTARPQASAGPIQQFLKSQGLNIPIDNITGLANSTGDAKAEWMLGKFAEGYNDMYFVDDAIQNVEAVKQVLNQLDVKSNVVQAKVKFSKNASKELNDMIERKKGIGSEKVFSGAEARARGKNIGRFDFYIPPSAEDFKGLLYYFLGKGKRGDADMKFFSDNLLKPFANGIRTWNTYKQNMADDFRNLKKQNPKVVKKLNNKIEGTSFTNDTAIRVYLWDKAGKEIPNISSSLQTRLVNHVNNNLDLKSFADNISTITKISEGYTTPGQNWVVGSIARDLSDTVNKVGRKQFLAEWIDNKDQIFTTENLNKIEAAYGTRYREALENILFRMENGGNRVMSKDRDTNFIVNWINGAVGSIMFFNMRSALLQTISAVNFINFSDNNIFKATKAFANQPQFWKDFTMLFNSDQLKQRRRGLQTDVSSSELVKSFKENGNSYQAVVNFLLEKGFTPTQIADSTAIAFGGASFYRNRYNKYIKDGKSPKEANEQAMLDFQEIAEETQQSSREDLVSKQQASVLGRIILAFQNVTMQYGRLTKKALSDLVNRRGDTKTNISKILYYGAVQNIVFASLQSALMFMLFSGDEEDEVTQEKETRVANNVLDSFLRGTGIYGALASTLKNVAVEWHVQSQKAKEGFKRDDVMKIAQEALNLSPPIGAKVRKIIQAYKMKEFGRTAVRDKLNFRLEDPKLASAAAIIEGITNIPTQRLLNKANNLEEAITSDHETWKRVAMVLGWSRWELGLKDEEVEAAREEVKEEKKEERKEKLEIIKKEKEKKKQEQKKKEEEEKKKKGIKTVRCSGIKSDGKRCKITTETADKKFLCVHHAEFKDGMDRDGDGKKEYRCTATTSSGKRCKNKTENKNKKCYAHQ